MTGYLPFAGRNSIAEMTIGVQFAVPFDSKVGESADAIRSAFAIDFPKYDPLQAFTVNFGSPIFPMPAANTGPNVSGFSLTKIKADTSPARILRVMTNMISAHFMEYTSWREIKPQATGYITKCIEILGILERNPAVGVLLRYVDRFTFDGMPESGTADALFKSSTKFVAPRVMHSGYQWHSNSGWFEPIFRDAQTLNNLNVSSVRTRSASGITVDHTSILNLSKPCGSLSDLIAGAGDRPALQVILDKQHDANASLLRDLLKEEMLDTIGLKG